MTSTPEGPGKDASRLADAPGQKRPHATLDLKATEVKSPPATSQSGSPGQKPAEPAKAESKPSVPASGPAIKFPGQTQSTPADKQSEPGKPPAAAKQADDKVPEPAWIPARTSSGFGRTLSHLTAGVLGGVLALVGSSWLPPGLIPARPNPFADKAAVLEKRLGVLEQSKGAAPVAPDVAGKLQETAARIAKLEAMAAAIGSLSDGQAKLQEQAKSLNEKMAKQGGDETADARLAKLEDKLSTLAAAAGTDPEKGRIPQLAAVTGRIADLENSFAGQVAALRKTIPEEVASRLAQIAEASEAARSGTQRIDRDVQALKTDAARIGQRVETQKADNDRLGAALQAVKEDQAKTTSALDGFKASVETQLKTLAKPADIASAVSPVSGKIAALEKNLDAVVKSEEERRTDAERVVISLELANLKRALDRGQGFSAELAGVRKAAGGKLDLAALDRYQNTGVPSLVELEREFRGLINPVIDAETEPVDASVVDRLVAGAKSVVRVRKINHNPDDRSAEAIVARMESSLKEGRLGEALDHAKGLAPKAAGRLTDWNAKAEARNAVERAIGAIEAQLKTSLSGAPRPAGDGAASPAAAAPRANHE